MMEKINWSFIAQELEEILPNSILINNEEYGIKKLILIKLLPIWFNAIKELSAKVKELESKLN